MSQLEERRWGTGLVNIESKTLPSLKAKRVLHSLLDLPQGSRVLDFGCGEGKLLNTVALHRPDLVLFGVDIQNPTDTHENFEFALISNDDCMFFKQRFDAILSLDVLEHVPDLEKTLGIFKSMLNKNGRVVLFVPMEGERFSPYGFYKAFLGKDIYVKTKSHIQAYQKKTFITVLSKHFNIGDVSYSYHAFGTILDSSFFALTSLKSLSIWWWKKNSIYYPENKNVGLLNKVMEWANKVCFAESEFLRNKSWLSSGLHVSATQRDEPSRST